LDKKVRGGVSLVKKPKKVSQPRSTVIPSTVIPARVSSIKPGLKCIGEVCFTDTGILVKIPAKVDPECAKATADYILGGKPVKFEIEKQEPSEKE